MKAKVNPIKLLTKRDVDAHVGRRLRMRRTMMGLSQEAVARSVGITFQQVQKYEKGSNAMNASRLYEFARLMNISVSYFFEEIEASAQNDRGAFSEPSADKFDQRTVSDREALEFMKAFKRIPEQVVRKRVADLVRAIADNKALLD